MKKRITLFLAIVLCVTSCFAYPQASAQAAKKKKPKLNVKKLNLTVGNDFKIRVYNLKKKQKISYSTSNADVVTIKSKKKNQKRVVVTAVSVGSATITGTIKKGKKVVRTLKCKVRVTPNAVGIKFLKRRVKLHVDQRKALGLIIKPNTSLERPVFESDNPDVATVNSRGVVTAVSPGTVKITATLLSCDVSTTCTITVLPEPDDDED